MWWAQSAMNHGELIIRFIISSLHFLVEARTQEENLVQLACPFFFHFLNFSAILNS